MHHDGDNMPEISREEIVETVTERSDPSREGFEQYLIQAVTEGDRALQAIFLVRQAVRWGSLTETPLRVEAKIRDAVLPALMKIDLTVIDEMIERYADALVEAQKDLAENPCNCPGCQAANARNN